MSLYHKVKVTVKNEFHNTESYIMAFYKAGSDQLLVKRSQYKTLRNRLCGCSDCCCGGDRDRNIEFFDDPNSELVEIICKNRAQAVFFEGNYKFDYPNCKGVLRKV